MSIKYFLSPFYSVSAIPIDSCWLSPCSHSKTPITTILPISGIKFHSSSKGIQNEKNNIYTDGWLFVRWVCHRA